MCDEQMVMQRVTLAKKLEKSEPQEASKCYLEVAQMLIELSEKNPEKSFDFIEMANKMYLKGKKVKSKKVKKGPKITKKNGEITFDSIGGLKELKEEIKFKIIEPFKKPELFKFYGKSIGGGILMYGPPGCGKSLVAKATANEAGMAFFHVKSSDLKSKFVGETEKNIAELFEKVRDNQPAIIFFDEFEALGSDRSEGHSHERSAVSQLLTEMDGMDSKNQHILLLAATNIPWSIDSALRREGRFGNTLFVPQPDLEARKQILEIEMGKRPTDELDYEKLAELTEGFSGADLKGICEHATNIPLKESFQTKKRRKISMDDVETAISKTQSVVKQWYAKAQQQVQHKRMEEYSPDLIKEARKAGVKEQENKQKVYA